MKGLLDPSSVAVIGASSDENKNSGKPIKYMQKHGYDGDIYPVNPNQDSIANLKCYPNIKEVPEKPDLALILLPTHLVLDNIKQSLEAGVKNLLVVSTGFAETQKEDRIEAQAKIKELAEEYNANIIGPGSQGFVNYKSKLTASFTPSLERDELVSGDIGFVTQSGAFGGALTTIFQESGIGLSKMVATGNEAVLGAPDIFEYLIEDGNTKIISGYIEGFDDGRKLIELKKSNSGIDTPIILLKVGESEKGRQAATSHTGTIAGRYEIYEGIFNEVGVISVDDIDQFFDIIDTLTKLSDLPSKKIGVVTTSGGAGVHIADSIHKEGLELPELSEETITNIQKYLPMAGSTLNPVDFATEPDLEERISVLEEVISDNNVETVIFQITNATGESAIEYAKHISNIYTKINKPLFIVWTGGIDKERAMNILEDAGVPVFENPVNCVQTISKLQQFKEANDRLRDSQDLPAYPRDWDGNQKSHEKWPSILTEVEGKKLLDNYNIPTVTEKVVSSADDAIEVADDIGYPVVAKIISEDLNHRTEVGGVRTGLTNAEQVQNEVNSLISISDSIGIQSPRVAIQPQIDGFEELAIGIIDSEDFGPVIMFGRGGTDIEDINDVSFRSIPIVESQARSMFDELDTVDIDDYDESQLDNIVQCIESISDLYMENQWIKEADINPIIITDEGPIAVDALFEKENVHLNKP